MLQDTDAEVVDDYDFGYFPDQSVSADQRIEILEVQVAELRQQVDSIMELLSGGRMPANWGNPWD